MNCEKTAVASAIRPVRFDSAGYLWGVGSAVLLRYQGGLYCLTADHVIHNQHASYEEMRVLTSGTPPAGIPFQSYLRPKSDKLDDDHLDIVVYKVIEKALERHLGHKPKAVALDQRFYPAKFMPDGCPLIVAGYPDADDRYDHDAGILRDHLLIKSGEKGDSQIGEPVYSFHSTPTHLDYRGMSGSPVLGWINKHLFFIGVVIRGSSSSGIMHFIDSTVVLATIVHLAAGAGIPLPVRYTVQPDPYVDH